MHFRLYVITTLALRSLKKRRLKMDRLFFFEFVLEGSLRLHNFLTPARAELRKKKTATSEDCKKNSIYTFMAIYSIGSPSLKFGRLAICEVDLVILSWRSSTTQRTMVCADCSMRARGSLVYSLEQRVEYSKSSEKPCAPGKFRQRFDDGYSQCVDRAESCGVPCVYWCG